MREYRIVKREFGYIGSKRLPIELPRSIKVEGRSAWRMAVCRSSFFTMNMYLKHIIDIGGAWIAEIE